MKKSLFILTILGLVLVAPLVYAQTCTLNPSYGSNFCTDQNGNACACPGTGSGSTGNGSGSVTGSNGNGSGSVTGPNGNTGTTLTNPLQGGTSLQSFLNGILAFVIRIGSIIVILMLVYVGFLFVSARGEAEKISEARRALLWTVIGALILLGAQAIALGIQATVNALSAGN